MARKSWRVIIIFLSGLTLGYILSIGTVPKNQTNPPPVNDWWNSPKTEASIPDLPQIDFTIEKPYAEAQLVDTEVYYTEGQSVEIAMDYYYGYWLVGEMAGAGYVYADIDPKGTVMGGMLSLSKDRAVFYGPKNTVVLDNPKYGFVLQNPPEFASVERASYSSFDFPNAFIVQMNIYDGDNMWWPEGLGPIWIKDIDTMFVRHHAFHEMKRVKPE